MQCDICGKEFPLTSGKNNKGRPFTAHRRWHNLPEYKKFQSKFKEMISKNNSGEKNGMWKGDDVKYCALHTRIKKKLPKPDTCQFCGQNKRLDLANISKEYKDDITDWLWLCRKCHQNYDGYTDKLHQRKILMDTDTIKEMYLKQKKSVYVIAKELHLSAKLIYSNIISPLRKELGIGKPNKIRIRYGTKNKSGGL
jgi:hypothetical protein